MRKFQNDERDAEITHNDLNNYDFKNFRPLSAKVMTTNNLLNLETN